MYTFNQLEVNDILYLGFESKNDKLMTSFSMFRDNQSYKIIVLFFIQSSFTRSCTDRTLKFISVVAII